MQQQKNVGSEVAHLREQIKREHQAASWALTSPALGTAQHRFITRRMERMGVYHQQLSALVGERTSIAMVAEIWASSPEQKGERHE